MIMLTYDKDCTDGFGSLLQRLISIYCICRKYNLKYVHTFFKDIRYQGLKALEKNENDKEFVNRVNDKFYKKSDVDIASIKYKIIKKNISLNKILELDKIGNNIILILTSPYYITNFIPNIYSYGKDFYKPKLEKNKDFTIGIHVRRGELFCVDSDRMMPNEYYINTVQKIIKVMEKYNFNLKIELYTEVPEKEIEVTGEHPGILNRIKDNIILRPDDNKIEEFDVLPKLNKYINEDVLITFDRMINSDILIMSRSSLSFSATVLKEGISVYKKPHSNDNWHPVPKNTLHPDSESFEKDIDKYILFYLLKKNHNFEL
jgi:hypothetical protein